VFESLRPDQIYQGFTDYSVNPFSISGSISVRQAHEQGSDAPDCLCRGMRAKTERVYRLFTRRVYYAAMLRLEMEIATTVINTKTEVATIDTSASFLCMGGMM
jgi:hypothetical protein